VKRLRHETTTFLAILAVIVLGCSVAERSFVPAGLRAFYPKAPDFSMPVFFEGGPPTDTYDVIGMICVTDRAHTIFETVTENEVVDLLKEEARKAEAGQLLTFG